MYIYLFDSIKATTPAAIGAAAEVPVKDLVQPEFPSFFKSVVTYDAKISTVKKH